jgi:hypothetical protein
MFQFQIDQLHIIEKAPTSPTTLASKFHSLVLSSVNARAKVEGVNPATGQYRVVLEGTLDKENLSSFGSE